eukprot:g12923.t1
MRFRLTNLTAALSLAFASSAISQEYVGPVGASFGGVGTPVDRNVADTGPNSASQRLMQPGLGQFGVGSLLLDRYDNKPHQFDRFNPIVGDRRTSHRYLMQAPGVTALMSRPDYIGPSPNGGWVFNQQTYDGEEVLTFSPDTVFVLSPELLAPPKRKNEAYQAWLNNPHRVRAQPASDPNALQRDRLITGQPISPVIQNHPAVQQDPNYVHPEIIERRMRLKAERESEAKKVKEQKAKTEPVEAEKPDAE